MQLAIPQPQSPRSGKPASLSRPVILATHNRKYEQALSRLVRFARHDHVPLLLEGESGTGKTVLARYAHVSSRRAHAPFVCVPLCALEDGLAGAELAGHTPDAFTGARHSRQGLLASANTGTVFLDEIGKASRIVQRLLLDFVESHEARPLGSDRSVRLDVRVFAASNVPLESLVERDQFLPDLFARLRFFRVYLPALRERREDIPALVEHFVEFYAHQCGYADGSPTLDTDLMRALQRAPWRDNIRELGQTVNRLLIDAQGAAVLTLDHCDEDLAFLRAPLENAKAQLTPELVLEVFARERTVAAAARKLRVDRTTLYRYLPKHFRTRPSQSERAN